MGGIVSRQVRRRKEVKAQKKVLADLSISAGDKYPGCDYHPTDCKTWMSDLGPAKLNVDRIVWPGTHDSATNKIGLWLVTRPFAQCQSRSIYRQLVMGARVLDVRVGENRRVYHGILGTYSVDAVLDDVKRFLAETESEIVLLEVRTEFGHDDPPGFDKYLVEKLGEDVLIPQHDGVFRKTVAELLPGRVICFWKPRKSPAPKHGDRLWSSRYLKDNWVDTDLPSDKFDSNMKFLSQQPPVTERKYFYRVENTVTPKADNPIVCVRPVTNRIHGYARLFISQAISKGVADRLQVVSTDFIDQDFVDACVGLTKARIEDGGP